MVGDRSSSPIRGQVCLSHHLGSDSPTLRREADRMTLQSALWQQKHHEPCRCTHMQRGPSCQPHPIHHRTTRVNTINNKYPHPLVPQTLMFPCLRWCGHLTPSFELNERYITTRIDVNPVRDRASLGTGEFVNEKPLFLGIGSNTFFDLFFEHLFHSNPFVSLFTSF